ncbi:MAG TPA: NAD(P)-dependent alcohol dehydrogenase, partial [Archangium sp.]
GAPLPSPPRRVKAMRYRRYGAPKDVLEQADVDVPVPGASQVLVKVEASSVNPIDWKRASGVYRLVMPTRFPLVPGFDLAGTVAALGPGVTSFAVGDRVHARVSDQRGEVSAEFALAGLDTITRMPDAMSMVDAAALPLAGMTALQGLRDVGGLSLERSSGRVLIIGASGGVGHFAVQLAKGAGAHVTGVCSARNAELVRSLGADAVVDYSRPDAFTGLEPFELILDCVGGEPGRYLPLVCEGGRYASCVPTPSVILRSAVNVLASKQVRAVMLETNAADLAVLDRWYAAGKLRVVIDSRFPLARLAEAWERSASGRAAGKIVVEH